MAAPPITERHKHHFHRLAPIKELVRAATTANITISTGLNNGDTIDGITLATGDRVLVKNQSAGAENGIWVVGVTPIRDYDVSTDDPGYGWIVLVLQGTTNAGTLWQNTNTSTPTIGTTALTFAVVGGGGSGMSDPMTTRGDMIFRNASNVTDRLPVGGTPGDVLTTDGTDPGWATPTGGAAVITVKDEGSTQSTTVDTLDFVGSGVVASGGGSTATITIAGGGSGGYPLDTAYSLDGTYGDHFTGASLSGIWTRRNYGSGAETYQLGPTATWIRINGNGRAVGDAYFQTAPGGDWTFAMKSIMPINQSPFGVAVVDTNGTGVACLPIYTAPSAPLLIQVTTYTSYGGNYVEPGIGGSNPNVNFYGAFPYSLGPFWQYLRKSGTNYYTAVSWDGELWGKESAALAWAGTVNRIGFMHPPLSASPTANTENTLDWFNKIA